MGQPLHMGHVPTPLSLAGSSIARVISGITAEHRRRGYRTSVAAAHNRNLRIPGANNITVDYSPVCPREWFNRTELAIDVALGRLTSKRPYYGKIQDPAIAAFTDVRPDVVFVHEGHYAAASLPRWRSALPDTLLVLHLHNPLSRSYSKKEARQLLQSADGLVFVSQDALDRESERFGPFPVPAAVVHNGVDLDLFHPRTSPAPTSDEPLSITYVGQVAPHKGVHLMLEAVAASAVKDASIRVIGSQEHEPGRGPSPYERSLRLTAQALNLNVEFIPFVPQEQVAVAFRSSDIVCVPSVWAEPFGMVAVEAMASGAAVVSSTRGGLPEACGGAATLVDPVDTQEFASALSDLADPAHLTVLKRRGIERATSMSWAFSYDNLISAIETW